MNKHVAQHRLLPAVLLLAASLAGCGLAQSTSAPTPVASRVTPPQASPFSTSTQATQSTSTATVAANSMVIASNSQTPVEIRAKGNLFIRRGPNLAFNPIAVLSKGQTAYPDGRDVLADWVRISLPGDESRVGWVSVMTDFTDIVGDVHSLPEIEPLEWPDLAFLRNCTYHEMMIEPGGITIPSVFNFPANDVRVNPGTYTVLDMDVDDYPEVLSVEIKEGSAVDIVLDGFGEKKKCPPP